MEGVHLDVYPLAEEDEDDSNSLVQFFKDVNVDLNASMRSYLGSQASNSRLDTRDPAVIIVETPAESGSEITNSQPSTCLLPSASNGEEGRIASRPNEASHSSSVLKSLGGSDSAALLQVTKDLQALADVILSTRQHISRCGLDPTPLSALHNKLSGSQKEMVQLLESASTGRGLLRKSAKVELMRFLLHSIHAVLCALVDQVGLLQKEASFTKQLKQDVEGHQLILISEQKELQEMIRAARMELLQEKKALVAHKGSMQAAKEEMARVKAANLTTPPVKHMQVTKYVHSSVPGRAEMTAFVRNQQELQKLEKHLLRSEQERKGLKQSLQRAKTELSATRESLDTLKNHHEALQRSSTKTIKELQQKLQLMGEEAARSKIALNMEKHKSGRVSKLADKRGKDLSHASLEAAVSGKTVGHLSHVVQQQQQREESLRQKLAVSQSAVQEREERLRKTAVNLVQQQKREESVTKIAKWQALKSNDKLAKSPLGHQLQHLHLQSTHHTTTKEHRKPTSGQCHTPPPLAMSVEELRDLAHFEDQKTAMTALKWLNDTLR